MLMHIRNWIVALAMASALVRGESRSCGQETFRLREAFPIGYQYHVSARVELTGKLVLPSNKGGNAGTPLAVTGSSALDYDERVLEVSNDGSVKRTVRIYRRADFERKVGDRPQESTIRPAVRRLVVLRHEHAEVPFSPDGPLTWGEIDLVRTDVFTPALVGLLPVEGVRVGDRWTASVRAIQELTDMERIDEGQVECRLEEITTLSKRRHARIGFSGTVRGVNEDGPNRQQLEGYLFFDLVSQHIGYLSLNGVSSLLDKDGQAQGSVEGRFVLTRQAPRSVTELGDEALKGVGLDPTDENTLLLYDNADLGVRFLYPRRWHVATVTGPQIALDEPGGSGLLITVEAPARVPTGAQFLAETQAFLQKSGARILRTEQPRRVPASGQPLEHFWLEADVNQQRAVLDYYVTRQKAGGATLSGRLVPRGAAVLQKEIAGIAESLVVGSSR